MASPGGGNVDVGRPRLLVRRGHPEVVRAGIDELWNAPRRRDHFDAVALHMKTGRRSLHDDGQTVNLRLELVSTALRHALPVVLTRLPRDGGDLEEQRTSRRGAPDVLVAVGEIELRADAGIELQALLELRTGDVVLAVLGE